MTEAHKKKAREIVSWVVGAQSANDSSDWDQEPIKRIAQTLADVESVHANGATSISKKEFESLKNDIQESLKPSSGWPEWQESKKWLERNMWCEGYPSHCEYYDHLTKIHLAETAKLRNALEVAKEALETLAKFEITYGAEGGVFDPKMGIAKKSKIFEVVCNPAKEALSSIKELEK